MIRPIITAVALALALGLYFAGFLSPDGLLAALTFAGLPGADALVRALRQRGAPVLAPLAAARAEGIESAARLAYERYGDACGWRTVGGGQMPRWADQHERLRLCWREAARGALGLQPGVNPGELAPVVPAILPTTPPADPLPAVDIEAAIESTWLSYDRERKQSGDERYTWKKYIRAAFDGQLGVAPTPPARSTPPSLPPIALLLLLLPLLALAPSCASWPAWRSALAACGVQVAPAGVQSGVALALHKGEGWAEALGELVSTYGGCLVKAQVQAHADGAGSDPPRAQAETAPLASLIGGELSAAPSAVTRAEAQQRAAAWLRGHR